MSSASDFFYYNKEIFLLKAACVASIEGPTACASPAAWRIILPHLSGHIVSALTFEICGFAGLGEGFHGSRSDYFAAITLKKPDLKTKLRVCNTKWAIHYWVARFDGEL